MAKRRAKNIDWLNIVDAHRAVQNMEIEVRGDWYRDPWGWPEVSWTLSNEPSIFGQRLESHGVRRCFPVDVPKENFAARPAVVLDPIDRIAYQALVDRLSRELIGSLPNWVYGWRLPPGGENGRGTYARNDYQFENYRSQLRGLTTAFDLGLRTDIVSFFANIDIDRLEEPLRARAGAGKVPDRLMDMLRGWQNTPGRAGLPQRSIASAVLANMYLGPVDDVLRAHGAIDGWFLKLVSPNGAACRWMDDVWLFGGDAGELRKAQLDIQMALRDLGLDMNFAKTELLDGEELTREALQLEHSAVDEGLTSEPMDTGPIEELADSILSAPERASRTSIRFLGTRMRRYKTFQRLDDLVANAHLMPHGADHLARLFRASEAWRDLHGWYLEYCAQPWSALDWSAAQLGTMFPSDSSDGVLSQHFGEVLSGGNQSLPLVSLASQRLSVWIPDDARFGIREAARTASHPLLRRSLALAAVAAGEERPLIRALLGEFEENQVVLKMLEGTNWRQPSTAADYQR